MSRAIHHSKLCLSRISPTSVAASRNGRFLSTGADNSHNNSNRSGKVEKEAVHVPPPAEKLLVLGGNGYIGSHICEEALNRGLEVASLTRTGRSTIKGSWANKVTWHQGNLFYPDSWKHALKGTTSIISCVGVFGSKPDVNATANINAIRAASEEGVKRFVYISVADFGVVMNYARKGYYEGKRAAEIELLTRYIYGGVILRPGIIYGGRHVGSLKLPFGMTVPPLETVFEFVKPLTHIPLVGSLLTSPLNVTTVAKAAIRAATDPHFHSRIVGGGGILRYGQ